MMSVRIYSNGNSEIKVYVHYYTNGSQYWYFTIGKKFYEYSKPSFAWARLEKLGYNKFVDSYVHHTEV